MSYSELANITATQNLLERFGVEQKHKLGQNFLIDDNIVGKILALAGLEYTGEVARDVCWVAPSILEVGPGIGTLTCALLKVAPVVSIERDADLYPILAEMTQPFSRRFALVEGDALAVSKADIEAACRDRSLALPRILVSNLPYQVAATLVLQYLDRFDFLETLVVMVQAEAADRMAARPGSKTYGAYTVKLALRSRMAGHFDVARSCFYPAPHVDSAVIRLDRRDDIPKELVDAASKVADAAFAQRRKTIRNSMRSRFDTEIVDALLSSCAIEPERRAETLSVDEYVALGEALLRLPDSC